MAVQYSGVVYVAKVQSQECHCHLRHTDIIPYEYPMYTSLVEYVAIEVMVKVTTHILQRRGHSERRK